MKKLEIEILNPKAVNLLNDLADLNLIAIKKTSNTGFSEVLAKLRSKTTHDLSIEEITKEVELVRNKRYAK